MCLGLLRVVTPGRMGEVQPVVAAVRGDTLREVDVAQVLPVLRPATEAVIGHVDIEVDAVFVVIHVELVAIVEAASLRPGGGRNAVISLPRAFLQKMDGGAGGLTGRQTEIVVLAARGFSNREIAEELHLAPATVKRHLANIYENLGVGSRNDAVRRALEKQWIGIHEITSADGNGSRDGQGG